MAQQTEVSLRNMMAIMEVGMRRILVMIHCAFLDIVIHWQVAGATFSSVIKATVFLADINDFDTVNDVYQMFFQEHFPARAAVQVG